MDLDYLDIAASLSFKSRYELRRRRWLDGPYASWHAFDRILEREVIVNVAYRETDAARDGLTIRGHSPTSGTRIYSPIFDLGFTIEALPYTSPSLSSSVSH